MDKIVKVSNKRVSKPLLRFATLISLIVLGGALTATISWAHLPPKVGEISAATYPPSHPSTHSITYTNTKFRFTFTLPSTWKGFTIVSSSWKGLGITPSNQSQLVETGPFLSIRNPLWRAKQPRQDIPIYIFTIKQWNELMKNLFSVGAAPIPPSELGRNSKYVFALPARYNYAFPLGFQEVAKILNTKPLKGF